MTAPEPPASWRAADPVDPRWGAPSPAQGHPAWPAPVEPPQRRRRRPVVAVSLVALALVIGLTAGFGGFGLRHDRVHDLSPGDRISTGPYVVTISHATAQSVSSLGQRTVRVVAYGTVANTGTEGQLPPDEQFYGKNPTDPDYRSVQTVSVGAAAGTTGGTGGLTVTPGLPPVPLQLEFDFDPTWKPSNTFRVAVTGLTQVDRTLGGKDPHLEADDTTVYRVDVPMTVLAPRT